MFILCICLLLLSPKEQTVLEPRRTPEIFTEYYSSESKLPRKGPNWDLLSSELAKDPDGTILSTALHFRLFKRFFQDFEKESIESFRLDSVLQRLESKLFPWINKHKGITGLRRSFVSEEGIVIATGQRYFSMAVHAIKTVRLWNCTLPIEVFHLGGTDLHPESIEYLNSMQGVTVVDIGTIFDMNILKLKSWDIKPFALLGSSFRKVILMDADAVFTRPPTVLFEADEFKASGTAFFYDRFFVNHKANYVEWFNSIIPMPHSQKLKESQLYKGKSTYEQESGVVVIDKDRRLMGLLAACLLNGESERKEIHSKTHGEKETFWLGFEIAQEPYEYLEPQAGLVGKAVKNAQTGQIMLCGHVAHFDKKGNLLWFNDGIVENKKVENVKLGEFVHVGNAGPWKGMCLELPNLQTIPPDQLEMIERIKGIWLQDPIRIHQDHPLKVHNTLGEHIKNILQ